MDTPKIALAIAALSLTACAPPREPLFEKPDVTVSQMHRDIAECRASMPFIAAGSFVPHCMEGRGYTVLAK